MKLETEMDGNEFRFQLNEAGGLIAGFWFKLADLI